MSLSSVLVLHGPNLQLLGTREPEIYGYQTLEDHVTALRAKAAERGIQLEHLQSQSEATLVEAIHAARGIHDGIIINAGAFTHYSWSIHDALRSFPGRSIEVHLSNPTSRENFRHVSVLAGVVDGSISGFGGIGYGLALDALTQLCQ